MSRQFELVSEFKPSGDQPSAIEGICDGFLQGEKSLTLLGVTGSGKTFSVANVIARTQRPTIILAPNKTLAAQLYGEMKSFFPNNAVEYFVSYYDYYQPEAYVPSTDTYIDKDASINEHVERMRLSATKAILERPDTIIVATVSAIYGLGDPNSYMKMLLHVSRGEIINQQDILKRLADMQYERNDTEFTRGKYRVRGDVIDIFPADSEENAIRIELMMDEIDRLTIFDPLTNKTINDVPRYTVYPKTHYVTPREVVLKAIDNIKEELRTRLDELYELEKLVEAQRLRERTQYDLEMIAELGYCSGIENYSRYLSGRKAGEPPPTLMDYLPDNALIVIDESHVTIPQLGAMYKGDRSRKENLVGFGFRLPSALDNRPLKFEEFEKIALQSLFISATPGNYELEHSSYILEQVVRPTGLIDPEIEIRSAMTQVEDVLSEINIRAKRGERVLITTLTKKMSEDLTKYLDEHNVRVRYLHSDIDTVERVEIIRDLRLGEFDVLVGINLLREGLDIPEVSLVAIFDADKEGFLRSDRSLIQTIGRAARNASGKAILYADRITGSMQRAIDETDRRRNKQEAYNKENNITPKTIIRPVQDVMERVNNKKGKIEKSFVLPDSYESWGLREVIDNISKLEKKMLKHSSNLEYEEAAAVRDAIKELEKMITKM